jgi:hypothetical protein
MRVCLHYQSDLAQRIRTCYQRSGYRVCGPMGDLKEKLAVALHLKITPKCYVQQVYDQYDERNADQHSVA